MGAPEKERGFSEVESWVTREEPCSGLPGLPRRRMRACLSGRALSLGPGPSQPAAWILAQYLLAVFAVTSDRLYPQLLW